MPSRCRPCPVAAGQVCGVMARAGGVKAAMGQLTNSQAVLQDQNLMRIINIMLN